MLSLCCSSQTKSPVKETVELCDLPTEIILIILACLDYKTKSAMSKVNRKFRGIYFRQEWGVGKQKSWVYILEAYLDNAHHFMTKLMPRYRITISGDFFMECCARKHWHDSWLDLFVPPECSINVQEYLTNIEGYSEVWTEEADAGREKVSIAGSPFRRFGISLSQSSHVSNNSRRRARTRQSQFN